MAISKGDRVKVHYTGKLEDGKEFDSSLGREPLEFVVGSSQIIPGFSAAVEGKMPGDKVTVTIPPADAYGEIDKDNIFTVARAQVPDHIPLEPGTPLQLSNEDSKIDVVISEVGADEVTLDANHPLAGKNLVFDIEILSAESPKN